MRLRFVPQATVFVHRINPVAIELESESSNAPELIIPWRTEIEPEVRASSGTSQPEPCSGSGTGPRKRKRKRERSTWSYPAFQVAYSYYNSGTTDGNLTTTAATTITSVLWLWSVFLFPAESSTATTTNSN